MLCKVGTVYNMIIIFILHIKDGHETNIINDFILYCNHLKQKNYFQQFFAMASADNLILIN